MSGTVGDNQFRASGVVATSAAEYDDDQIQSNIAMLGFYVAVNGSLVRYNLVDQSIDEFYDTSGVDASASTNENRVDTGSGANFYYDGAASATVTEDADDSGTDGLYSWYKWTDTAATGSYENSASISHDYLVVAGGGGGGGTQSGAGGAGGFRTATGLSLVGGTTYTITVGAGGPGQNSTNGGDDGSDSILSGSDITDITSTGGGGGGSFGSANGAPGGSGGGGGSQGGVGGGTGNSPSTSPAQGYNGGTGQPGGPYIPGGGGGASEAGNTDGQGHGGDGVANAYDGTPTTYAGGGGGGYNSGSPGGDGGGGQGSTSAGGTPGTNGLGGGGGGSLSGTYYGGAGGSGVVILRYLTASAVAIADLTLQSTDVTALSAPDYAEFVTLIENAYGTATLNTDIKGYISRDSGSNFTQGTLVDEGTWGTNKKILGFHDLDISGQPSGTSMCYKITTHNQVASSKETRIYATSIGWR